MGYHSYPSPADKDVAHVKQNVQKDAFYSYKGMLGEFRDKENAVRSI